MSTTTRNNKRFKRVNTEPTRFEVLPGLPFTVGMSELIGSEKVTGEINGSVQPPDPFEPGSLSAFVEWLGLVPNDSRSGLPRYMEAMFLEEPLLSKNFPEVKNGELSRFLWWCQTYGRVSNPWLQVLGHTVPERRSVAPEGRVSSGTDVVGFFNAEHGVGEAARLLVEALRENSVLVSTIGYRNTISRQLYEYETDEVGQYRTVLMAVNGDHLPPLVQTFGDYFLRDTYVIGQWFWELEVAPPWYKPAYKYVKELWAPTRFIEQMLRNEAPREIEVRYMPLPLRMPRVVSGVSRDQLGLDDRFMFLFTFDFMSVMKRKNPLGLVEAFKKAFDPGEGPMLVLKSINGDSRPEASAELKAVIEGRDDIIWIDKYLDSEMSAALMNLCDCYVSLHRSEGLGLTIAEAMLLGKPVIATAYSGNLDFMTPGTSYMVPWTRVKVGKGAEAYSSRATWAEPNLDVAAEMMRTVYENPEQAQAVANAGKRDLEERFTREATGARMKSRLEEIWESLDGV
jgi:glycosyltransferase involved in cell wall biosynthesis